MATKSVGGPVLPRTEALAHWHRPGYADYCLVCRRRCEWHTRAAVGLLGDKVLRNRNRCVALAMCARRSLRTRNCPLELPARAKGRKLKVEPGPGPSEASSPDRDPAEPGRSGAY